MTGRGSLLSVVGNSFTGILYNNYTSGVQHFICLLVLPVGLLICITLLDLKSPSLVSLCFVLVLFVLLLFLDVTFTLTLNVSYEPKNAAKFAFFEGMLLLKLRGELQACWAPGLAAAQRVSISFAASLL